MLSSFMRRLHRPALAAIASILLALGSIAQGAPAHASTPLSGATRVGAGGYHTCVVTASGGVQCWGWNRYGQLGNGKTVDSPVAVDTVGLGSGIVAVATGETHSCAVTSGGGVKCWGYNTQGELGVAFPTIAQSSTPVDVPGLSGVVAITAGRVHTCVRTVSGGVKCWGNNYWGQLGTGGTASGPAVVDVVGLGSGVIAVAGGDLHTCALTSAGAMKCWGANHTGQLGTGSTQHVSAPTDVVGLASGVSRIAPGGGHTCALLNGGQLKCWGANSVGQLGNGSTTDALTPTNVTGLGAATVAVATGLSHSCAIVAGGGVKCWGYNLIGQLGDGTTLTATTPVDVLALGVVATTIASSAYHTCVLVAGGVPLCWGLNQNGQLGNAIPSASPDPVDVVGVLGATAIATGEDHVCALTSGGSVKCWGRNVHGALGNGSTQDSFLPVDVIGLGSPITRVRAGGYGTCAIDTAGGVVCWGYDFGAGSPSPVPTPVPGLASGVTDVTLGGGHICALTLSGGVKCWGGNSYGQLGNGSTVPSATPVEVTGLSANVVAIGAGRFHTCAALSGGGVRCWGDNQAGQLGSGFGGFESTPVTVSALTEAAFTVDGGDLHSCAQTASFGMACWGANDSAQLGIGHTYPTSGAVTVPLSTGTLAVATGASHSCQLGGGGTVRCWGLNEHGQVGIGTTDRALRPLQVPGIAGANAVSASGYHTCSLMGDGSVKCWGNNANGQLGNGVGGYATSPQTVLLASCGGFGDVVAGNPFCANVEWNRNRLVTLGCAPESFCGSAPVSRIAMSAFMNRLATALTPTTAIQQNAPGALDPSVAVVVCATADHPTGSQPRRAYLDAVFGAIAAADVRIAVRLVWSPDSGLSWYGFSGGVNGVARAGQWTNLRMLDSLDLADGYDIRYGMDVSRGGLPGTGTLTDSTCNLRVRIDNRDAPATQ